MDLIPQQIQAVPFHVRNANLVVHEPGGNIATPRAPDATNSAMLPETP